MSALPPKADIRRIVTECLLLTQSRHSVGYEVQQVGAENQARLNSPWWPLIPAMPGPTGAGVTFIRCRSLLSLRPKRVARSAYPVPQVNPGRPQGAETRS